MVTKPVLTLASLTASALQAKQPLALLLDYDGTLTPIVNDPKAAQLSDDGLASLAKLTQKQPHVFLAVVSGRSVEQLQGFLLQPNSPLVGSRLLLSGLHGGQVYDVAAGRWVVSPQTTGLAEVLDALEAELAQWQLTQGLSLYFERKHEANLAVHYRQCPPEQYNAVATSLAEQGQACVAASLAKVQLPADALRLQTGHCVAEWLPTHQTKGHAVRQLVDLFQRQLPEASARLTPVFLGDDATDEAAFEAAIALGGFGVRVGACPETSLAQYHLASPQAVLAVLANV